MIKLSHLPTMMFLHFHTAATPFYLFQILLLLASSACVAQVSFFINCGSSTNATTNNQNFVGDQIPNTLVHFSRKSSTVSNPDQSENPSSESLYQTARVFKIPSSYDFDISQASAYFVRLHFYAFSPLLASAKFNVSASGQLLAFIPGNIPTKPPIIKEFILRINQTGKFIIYFVPSPSSLAFINAIEVVSTTSNIVKDSVPYVTPAGSTRNYTNQNSPALETIYMINVGGDKNFTDNLGRTWTPDDSYLINKCDAQNTSKDSVSYSQSTVTIDDAPQTVYGTAKRLKDHLNSRNLTWMFSVKKGTQYFVRAHLCDIISPTTSAFGFNFYIYSNFSQIQPLDIIGTDTPFYKEYVVESVQLDYINISVGPIKDGNYSFLNGLEIMQVLNQTANELSGEKDSHLVLIASLVASAVAVALIVILAAVAICLRQKKRRKKPTEAFEWGNLPLHGATSSHNRASDTSSSHASTFQNLQLGLKIPFVEIQRVTNNFDANLIVGEGGFGKVYKGTLINGIKVAVKRSNPDHGQGIAEFQTEIMILSAIRHLHLVSLIGYCYENGEMILVYEFMEKGTLRYHLYDWKKCPTSSNHGVLSWKQRLEICIGAAKGIQYLHTGTNKGIIHRDVKSTNILLDEKYVAKVADFGLSRSGYLEESQVSISDVKGTLGYLDPEYFTCLQLTEKSDVYSFGVVLIEVLCARSVIDLSLPREQINLADWAMACYEDGKLETIIDPLIAGEINPSSLKRFCETAERCLKKDAAERPAMSDVCWGLEYALQLQKVATERVLLDDSMTDASLNMTLPAVRRFPSQSIANDEYDDELLNTSTGEVFSQLTFDDGTGR